MLWDFFSVAGTEMLVSVEGMIDGAKSQNKLLEA